MDKPWKAVFVAEYLNNGNNATQAYLKAKPESSHDNARARGSETVASSDVKQEIQRQSDKVLNKTRYSKEIIMDNIEVIRKKTLKDKQYPTSLKANKELAELGNLYDRGVDDPGQYRTLIQSLVIHQTTISSGTTKQLEDEDTQVIDITPEKE